MAVGKPRVPLLPPFWTPTPGYRQATSTAGPEPVVRTRAATPQRGGESLELVECQVAGTVKKDLFADDRSVLIRDVELLNELASRKRRARGTSSATAGAGSTRSSRRRGTQPASSGVSRASQPPDRRRKRAQSRRPRSTGSSRWLAPRSDDFLAAYATANHSAC